MPAERTAAYRVRRQPRRWRTMASAQRRARRNRRGGPLQLRGDSGSVGLPLADREQLVAPRHRVLVVEDDAELRELLALALGEAGYDTTVVDDSRAAFRAAESWRPDLILLDLSLLGMDGTTFRARQLRSGL